MRRSASTLLTVLSLVFAARAQVSEPEDYRRSDYRAPTPATLSGATVLSTEDATALWRDEAAIFIDVLPRAPKPANLPQGTLWHPARRDAIPGSAWLVDTGYGDLAPETEAYFRQALARLTKGDRQHPLVFYCQRDCWMSWNAARRALALGYGSVAWYPDGTDGWAEDGLPLERHEPLHLAPADTQ
ncbi:PQQ-dependent catabolism-associated CXXCW motif protein [Aureimonas frigidaquae]|uniref:PQQ-dependent catabolism-associated CXXCW motif protein n=1 Tax=Aureimonas frigidaquae TaxID=424757 RepID=UPI0007832BBD|nr:PQQ-dependent catabolism-associated CXXCW motif protein [Aureimonas frigidaquae]